MNWLSNGSKTLVTCMAMACITALSIFKTLTPELLAAIVGLTAAYGAVNVVQNRGGPTPPPPPAP